MTRLLLMCLCVSAKRWIVISEILWRSLKKIMKTIFVSSTFKDMHFEEHIGNPPVVTISSVKFWERQQKIFIKDFIHYCKEIPF